MPRFSDDDVTDFMVLEAVAAQGGVEQEAAQERATKSKFRKGHRDWQPGKPYAHGPKEG